ncbi:mediator of RNA polymerase II transcription subunit 25 isoform X2 [Lycium ferocissimum]|uniref:mediator of RNA polymerase II transcription subunit 25 isoform X2 n=1 Tax=Lycium ferocissimum TaxID=112874 RepID=UPI002814CF32|nr:mediator of RNA polymerase II transcription subunit 25 isoform X2 [Lycium ferocissimum]
MFFQRLSAIPFSGGGFDDAAVAEGLAAALTMFASLNGNESKQNADGRRHCILVAASNPCALPRPIYCPVMQNLEQTGNTEAHTGNVLADAETVARAFPQCSVSLSVICPRKLLKVRAIYNAGKCDPEATDPPVDTSKNPNYLVLISEHFSEACAALSRTEMESLAPNQSEMAMSSVPLVSGPAATSNPAVMNQEPISAGNIPAAAVNIETTKVTSSTGLAPPHQLITGMGSCLPISVSEEMLPNNENTKETIPIVSVMTQSLHPFSGAAGNVSILNGVTSAVPAAPAVLSSGQLGVTSMTEFSPFAGTGQIDKNSDPASLTSMASSMSGNSNLCMSQLLGNTQGGIGASSQTAPVMSQGNLPGSQIMQSGNTGMPSGIGTMMPTQGMTQLGQPEMLPLGRNNSTEANMSLSQQQTSAILPSAQSKFVKFWEGDLYGNRQGQPLHITRLQGFKSASASESLAANWPPTMQIIGFITKQQMIDRRRTGRADRLFFWAMEQHALLSKVQAKKDYAVIQLPSQTMYLYVDRIDHLFGIIFPHEIPNQQLPAHHSWAEQLPQQQPLPQLQQQQPHRLQLKQQQPLLLQQQQQQQSLQQLPHQQPRRLPLKRQRKCPLQEQSKVPRIHQQQTPQSQQQQQVPQMQHIEQQQPIIGTAVNQAVAYMQGTGRSQLMSQTQASSPQGVSSIPEDDLLNEHRDEIDVLLTEGGDELDNAFAEMLEIIKFD